MWYCTNGLFTGLFADVVIPMMKYPRMEIHRQINQLHKLMTVPRNLVKTCSYTRHLNSAKWKALVIHVFKRGLGFLDTNAVLTFDTRFNL